MSDASTDPRFAGAARTPRQDHRGAPQLPRRAPPSAAARRRTRRTSSSRPPRSRASGGDDRAPGRHRAARLRGRDRAVIGTPARRVSLEEAWAHVALGHRRQRPRRLRPRARRQGLQPPLQGRRRVHPARPGPASRRAGRPGRAAAPHLGQRRARPGRHHRRPALPASPGSSPTSPSCSPSNRATSSSPAPRRALRGRARATSSRSRSTRRSAGADAPAASSPPSSQGERTPVRADASGRCPAVDDVQRAEAWGALEPRGHRPSQP